MLGGRCMNITDVTDKIPDSFPGDRLGTIFTMQLELMEKYHPIEKKNDLLITEDVPVNLQSYKGQQRLKDFAWRITEELGEAMSCLKNKPWKATPMDTDVDHYKEEIADAFHFFVELCILSGIGAHELFSLYFKKSRVNRFRQGSGY
jgi:NTP pyrophosphatase (non-canonical NTP hydrolase)